MDSDHCLTVGWSGQTTLAAHPAVDAERTGAVPVAVVDTDPQGSLAAQWNARDAPTPLFAAVAIVRLSDHLGTLEQRQVQLVVIDTPPALTDMILAAIAVTDLVVIPARPSPHDLRAIDVMVAIAEASGTSFYFVVTGATPRTTIAQEAVHALAQHGQVAPVTVHQRIDFAASMVDGRTVGELNPRSRSSGEVAALWQYEQTCLRQDVKRA